MRRFRVILSAILCLFVSLFANAQAVSFDKAKSLAPNGSKLVYTATTDKGEPAFYVVNKPAGGFLILSAEEGTRKPILGYSNRGIFNYDQLPANMKSVLMEYTRGISQLKVASPKLRQLKHEALRKAAATGNAVEPLLGDIEWGQGWPYCLMCPKLNGSQCVTGCVATAVAQIMRYHKWPEQGNGEVSYYWYDGAQTLTADLSQSVYQWDKMLPNYNAESTTEEQQAVALLMRDVGYAFKMSYSPSGSGTTFRSLAMVENFGYDRDLKMMQCNYCSVEEMEAILRSEIDAGRPVCCCGGSSSGAHEFVCDGYDANGYFHYNFGWDGVANAYLLCTATGFDSSPSLDYNIKKDEGGTGALSLCQGDDFKWTSGDNISCSITMWCRGAATTADLGLALKNKATDEVQYFKYYSMTIAGGENGSGLSAMTFPDQVADGEYILYPVAKISSATEWETFTSPDLRQRYVDLKVSGGVKTYENNNLQDPLDDGKVEVDGVYYILNEEALTASVTYRNERKASYKGEVVIPDEIEYEGKTYRVTELGTCAFEDCSEMTGITIGKNVQTIAMGAFGSCNVEKVTFAEGSQLQTIGGWAFNGCSKLTEFTIPEDCQIISMCAFQSCFGLTMLTIPSSVNFIASVAFNACSGLQDVYVSWENPATDVTAISNAFDGVYTFTCNLHVPAETKDLYAATAPWSDFIIVEAEKPLAGDANIDGVVDVADITAIASYILGATPQTFSTDNADANSDGVIDVADITATATIILTPEPGPEPEPEPTVKNYFVVGTPNGWDNTTKSNAMYPLSETAYSYTASFTGGWDMKIWEESDFGNWNKAYATESDGWNGASGSLSKDYTGAFASPAAGYYTINLNAADMTYTWTLLDNQEPATYSSMGLMGSFNNWSEDMFMQHASGDSHNWYLLGFEATQDLEVKFRANGSWDYNWGVDQNIGTQNYGTGVSFAPNITLPKGTYDIYMNDITGQFLFVSQLSR